MISPIPQQTAPSNDVQDMLKKESSTLSTPVINKVMTSLECAANYHVAHNNILTIIDYSLPSSEKRLWVFDLKEKKLLFNTYVSHGITSGTLLSKHFSNKNNSKATSIGIYKTEKTYYGRDGLSLRLEGLDKGFNHNASNRYIVMHGGWYVDEQFIKKYGRAGRSWGCPAIPLNQTQEIINTIKDSSFFVAYYPSDNWFAKSKFLTCESLSQAQNQQTILNDPTALLNDGDTREDIVFADINKNNRHDENEPIVVISADTYLALFQNTAPLERMLRRQINNMEYVALSNTEFNKLLSENTNPSVYFVIPVIKMQRGYYATQMNIVSIGKIKNIRINTDLSTSRESTSSYAVELLEKPAITLKTTHHFIRWLGL